MSDVPLLAREQPSSSCLSFRRAILKRCHVWKQTVLSESYLSSGVSRRQTWRWILPCAALYCTIQDIMFPNGQIGASPDFYSVTADCIALAVLCGVSRLDIKTLKPDCILTGLFALQTFAYDFTIDKQDYQTAKFGIQQSGLLVAFLGVMGVHSVCLAALAASYSLVVMMDSRTLPDTRVLVVWTTTVFAFVFGAIEFFLAKLVEDLQSQLMATQTLLDKASDGFCAVNSAGVIQRASPGMSVSFGCDCRDRSLKELVMSADDVAKIDMLLASDWEQSLQHVLVTCCRWEGQALSHVFEALICRYQVSRGTLDIFVRITGEIRECSKKERIDEAFDVDDTNFDSVDDEDSFDEDMVRSLVYSVTTNNTRSKRRLLSAEAAVQTDACNSKPPLPSKKFRKKGRTRKTQTLQAGGGDSLGRGSSPKTYQNSLSNTCLRETSTAIRIRSVARLLQHWKTQLDERSCCPVHAHIQECKFILKKLNRVPCRGKDEFCEDMGDEQCARCGMVNFFSDDEDPALEEPPPCPWCSSCPLHEIIQLQSDTVSPRKITRQTSISSQASAEGG